MTFAQTQVQNLDGKWVQAIPLPHLTMFGDRCACGMRFYRRKSYRGHYALVHILKLGAR